MNLGQGAALETARQLALAGRPFDAYVTMDADGQHRIEDLAALVAAVEAGADVALGDRFAGDSNVPAARRALIHGARLFERALTGLRLSDAHNGFRAFSRRALERVPIRENRMAHATEITRRISRARLSVVEVPVSVRYTPTRSPRASGRSAPSPSCATSSTATSSRRPSEPRRRPPCSRSSPACSPTTGRPPRQARRMLLLEAVVFVGGAFFIAFPDAATALAHAVGIGRGVDFILYPLVIWLVRESLLNRRRRWEDAERLTQLVRAQAIAGAVEVGPRREGPSPGAPG